mgnify:CR=1 FL=1
MMTKDFQLTCSVIYAYNVHVILNGHWDIENGILLPLSLSVLMSCKSLNSAFIEIHLIYLSVSIYTTESLDNKESAYLILSISELYRQRWP